MYDLLVVVRHTVLSPDAWLQAGEVVRFGDFLRALPKATEEADEDFDEEELLDPKQAIV